MFTTTEDEPAISHAWLDAWFLGGCTVDDADALRDHAFAQLCAAGVDGQELHEAIEDMEISFAPIPELEAGDLCYDEEMYDTDPEAEYVTATLFVKGHGPIGDVTLRNGRPWGDDPCHWAGRGLLDWFMSRGHEIADHIDAIVDAVADAKEGM